MMAFSSNSNIEFIIVLKLQGHISFSPIFKIIFHNFLCCFKNSYFENVIHNRQLNVTAMCLIMMGLNSIFNELNEAVNWGCQ